jgi:F0F1-type ATP synthase alpha subunit
MEEEVVILFMGAGGYLMDVETAKVPAYVKGFVEYLKIHKAGILETIAKTGETSVELEQELVSAIEDYKASLTGK